MAPPKSDLSWSITAPSVTGSTARIPAVPFADKMSPPRGQSRRQARGKRYPVSGMPRWKGILSDEEMLHIVHFVRYLPPQASLGIPKTYKEEAHEHEAAVEAAERPTHPAGHAHKK